MQNTKKSLGSANQKNIKHETTHQHADPYLREFQKKSDEYFIAILNSIKSFWPIEMIAREDYKLFCPMISRLYVIFMHTLYTISVINDCCICNICY